MIERYTNPDMGRIWSDQRKYETWLQVELAAVDVIGVVAINARLLTLFEPNRRFAVRRQPVPVMFEQGRVAGGPHGAVLMRKLRALHFLEEAELLEHAGR